MIGSHMYPKKRALPKIVLLYYRLFASPLYRRTREFVLRDALGKLVADRHEKGRKRKNAERT